MTEGMKEIEYKRARNLISDNLDKCMEAKKIFTDLDDYKESRRFLQEVTIKINVMLEDLEVKKEEDYNRAIELISSNPTAQKHDQAIKIFRSLDDYKDSKEILDRLLVEREKMMKKDKKNLDRFKLLGYLCAGLGVIMIVLIICAVIWSIVSNGGAE